MSNLTNKNKKRKKCSNKVYCNLWCPNKLIRILKNSGLSKNIWKFGIPNLVIYSLRSALCEVFFLSIGFFRGLIVIERRNEEENM